MRSDCVEEERAKECECASLRVEDPRRYHCGAGGEERGLGADGGGCGVLMAGRESGTGLEAPPEVRVCVCARACVCVCVRACVRACVCKRASARSFVRSFVRSIVRSCVCVRACVRALTRQ